MPIIENPNGAAIPGELLEKFRRVSHPTLGHFYEQGFVEPAIQSYLPGAKIAGRAVTVQIPGIDSALMHRAVSQLEEGDVLVIATGGDTRHAPVGEVVAYAARHIGAAAIVIDGVMTDVNEVAALGIPVFARGKSVLTTKLLGLPYGGVNVPISIGGVAINPGDVVFADDNGVLAIPVDEAAALIDTALESDEAEHRLLSKIDAGVPLPDVTAANARLASALGIQSP